MRRRGPWLVLAGVLAALVAIGAAYWVGVTSRADETPAHANRTPVGSSATSTSSHKQPSPSMPAARPSHDPIRVAKQWLTARDTVSWADRPPTAWIGRAAPVVTGKLAKQQQAASRGGLGADWPTFVRHRCQRTLTRADAVVPPEAPRTSKTVYVQVTGTVSASCAAGALPPAETGSQHDSATVQADRQANGTWKLSQQIH